MFCQCTHARFLSCLSRALIVCEPKCAHSYNLAKQAHIEIIVCLTRCCCFYSGFASEHYYHFTIFACLLLLVQNFLFLRSMFVPATSRRYGQLFTVCFPSTSRLSLRLVDGPPHYHSLIIHSFMLSNRILISQKVPKLRPLEICRERFSRDWKQ